MKKWLIVLALLASGSAFAAGSQGTTRSETLLQTRTSWDGAVLPAYPSGQPEITVLKITIPAHSQLNWHSHPVINTAYVLSGSLTVIKKDNGQRIHLTAGQTLPELVNTIHRGETEDEPAVLLVFYAGKQGTPLAVPEKK